MNTAAAIRQLSLLFQIWLEEDVRARFSLLGLSCRFGLNFLLLVVLFEVLRKLVFVFVGNIQT